MPKSNAASSVPDRGAPAPLALVGATATGKTAVGLLLAEALGTDIIGCDSRQIYRGLDIGTAKPTAAERCRVRHHLVDVAGPGERFSAMRYRECVLELLPGLVRAGRVPLFVGGTGLYLRAALEGLCPAPAASPRLRRWLDALADGLPGGLHPLLARVDPDGSARIHPNDRYRAARALEVYLLAGEPLHARQSRHRASRAAGAARIFAIDLDGREIQRRIGVRLEAMLAAGFLEEARGLLAGGLDPALPALRAVGYPELFAHLRGQSTLEEALALIRRNTWQYARRQLTWFRAVPGIVWIAGGAGRSDESLAARILELAPAVRGAR